MKLKYYKLARKMSMKSDHKCKLGAVLVYKGNVVSAGYNQLKTHPKSTHPYKSTHAELAVILNSKLNDLSGCDMYIYRQKKDGSLGLSKPCTYCTKLLKMYNVRNVYYTTEKYPYYENLDEV